MTARAEGGGGEEQVWERGGGEEQGWEKEEQGWEREEQGENSKPSNHANANIH